MLKSTSPENKLTRTWGTVRKAVLGVASLSLAAAITGGCLQRPVEPQDPRTNNVYVDQIRQTAVDKIDLLFMIDNSISMADKQQILKDAVPVLVNRLISPNCVDPATAASVGSTVDANGACPAGSEPEFNAIKDIHIGIVSSSLGPHGGQVCGGAQLETNPTLDDHGRLMGAVRPGLAQWNNAGFLAWDPTGTKNSPPGEASAETLITNFANHVTSTGENGCGYEASLEAWYRFLIDPDPPESVAVDGNGLLQKTGTDAAVLAQRDAFLRPDSLVAIVMLTDENDCSIIDEGQGWLVGLQTASGGQFRMPRSTSTCATDPNSDCCRSCASSGAAPSGCDEVSADPECAKGAYAAADDEYNLRCFDQRRRFGFNLLYSHERYVNGLSNGEVPARDGVTMVQNPLYAPKGDKPARDKSLVFLAGIIGVPWQDVSDEASWTGPGLQYLTAAQLREENRWDLILGDPAGGTPPTDPLMIEQVDPRAGTHPLLNIPVVPASSPGDPQANIINGHEQAVLKRDDLQYACIFPLNETRDCSGTTGACDCFAEDVDRNRPLCQPPGGGPTGTTQYYAKAYPGVRHLQVLKDYGDNAIVASICPKQTQSADPASDPNYGYNPAVGAIISRLKEALTGKCLPRQLVPETCGSDDASLPECGDVCDDSCYNPDRGKVPCAVIEALFTDTGSCGDCEAVAGRAVPDEEIRPAVIENLIQTGQCDNDPNTERKDCSSLCLCEIEQLAGAQLSTCQTAPTVTDPSVVGYCYIDKKAGIGSPELVAKCPATEQRILRFVDSSNNTPQRGAVTFIACLGATLGQQPSVEEVPAEPAP